MAKKKAKPPHVYLISRIRQIWRWGQERKLAIALASRGPDLVQCAKCGKLLPKNMKKGQRKLYAVDHIEPIVPTDLSSPRLPLKAGSCTWDEYLQRSMFGALQVLCQDPCHAEKTKLENSERKKAKSKSKTTVPALRKRAKR